MGDLCSATGCGRTLNVEERAGLEAAMAQRRLEERLVDIKFWGKIEGQQKDYLVVYGMHPSQDHPDKQFYFWYVIASPWCAKTAVGLGWTCQQSVRGNASLSSIGNRHYYYLVYFACIYVSLTFMCMALAAPLETFSCNSYLS